MTLRELKYRYLDLWFDRLQIALNLLRSRFSTTRKPVYVARTGRLFEVKVDGQVIYAPWIRRWKLYRHGFDDRQDRLCRRYGLHDLYPEGEDEWVIDVGAYMGEWSIDMSRRGFSVLAIEPDPDAADCFTKNLTLMAHPRRMWLLDTRVCHDHAGQVTYYLESHHAGECPVGC